MLISPPTSIAVFGDKAIAVCGRCRWAFEGSVSDADSESSRHQCREAAYPCDVTCEKCGFVGVMPRAYYTYWKYGVALTEHLELTCPACGVKVEWPVNTPHKYRAQAKAAIVQAMRGAPFSIDCGGDAECEAVVRTIYREYVNVRKGLEDHQRRENPACTDEAPPSVA